MGHGKPSTLVLVFGFITCLVLTAQSAIAVEPTPRNMDQIRLASVLEQPVTLPSPGPLEGMRSVLQDVVTVDEYERLTGVHKRLGLGFFGGAGILTASDGSAGQGLIKSHLLDVSYDDIWSTMGIGGGVDFAIMVMPLYTVHVGVGVEYRAGLEAGGVTGSYPDVKWGDMLAIPMYLGVRVNLPLGVPLDRWLDFENPDIAAEQHGLIPIPYLKVKAIGFLLREIYVDGWIVEPGKASVGGTEEYIRRGIYGSAYGGFGIEVRMGSVGFYGEVGFRYVWTPKLTLRFDELLTNGDFAEIRAEFGISYYFGSGRIIKVGR